MVVEVAKFKGQRMGKLIKKSTTFTRSKDFKEDAGTWKSSEDGKVVSGQPARVVDERNGGGPMATSYIAK